MVLASVDLPAPLGPIRACTWPSQKSTLRSLRMRLPPSSSVTSCSSRIPIEAPIGQSARLIVGPARACSRSRIRPEPITSRQRRTRLELSPSGPNRRHSGGGRALRIPGAMGVIWAYAHNNHRRRPSPPAAKEETCQVETAQARWATADDRRARGSCGHAHCPRTRRRSRPEKPRLSNRAPTGWQRAQVDPQAAAPTGEAPDALTRVEDKLTQALKRLDRLESATRD